MTSRAPSDNTRLSRIRESQRRSRARKREYLEDLEARWQKCKELGVQANVELQQAARRVIEENELLREVLLECGVAREEVEKRIKVLKERKKVEHGGAPSAVTVVDNGCGMEAHDGCAFQVDDLLNDLALENATGETVDLLRVDPLRQQPDTTPRFDAEPNYDAELLEGFPLLLGGLDASEFLENLDHLQSLPWPSLPPAPPPPAAAATTTTTTTTSPDPAGTTPCLEAYRVLKALSEQRGEQRDLIELMLELSTGSCSPESGCRVDNEVLGKAIDRLT